MATIKQVCLDWDGVLCDSVEIYYRHVNHTFIAFGKPPFASIQEYKEQSEALLRVLFEKRGITNVEEARKFCMKLILTGPKPPLYQHAHDTLRWLKDRKKRVTILSAHPEEDLIRMLYALEIRHLIDDIRAGLSPEEKAKEACKIMQEGEYSPKELIVVDDSVPVLETMKPLGCHVFGSAYGHCSPNRIRATVQSGFVLHDIRALQNKINRIEQATKTADGENACCRRDDYRIE